MPELLTAAQMRDIENAAIRSGKVTGLELMERAGQGVVDAILREWPVLSEPGQRAVILCGPGNNGGDGYVVARLLHQMDWRVDVFLYGDPEKLPPDARKNYVLWTATEHVTHLGFPVATPELIEPFCDRASHRPDLRRNPRATKDPAFVVIDALFGIGLTRPISGLDDICAHWDYLSTFRDLNNYHLVAIDIPSGLSSDTGEVLYSEDPTANPFGVLAADLTVTFHRKKVGHVKGDGPNVCGKVVVVDIGL